MSFFFSAILYILTWITAVSGGKHAQINNFGLQVTSQALLICAVTVSYDFVIVLSDIVCLHLVTFIDYGMRLCLFLDITKTCLYNFDPLKPHFYIAKLGFTGVYIIFLISAQKHRLWVLVRTASPRRF